MNIGSTEEYWPKWLNSCRFRSAPEPSAPKREHQTVQGAALGERCVHDEEVSPIRGKYGDSNT
jgi:hypothetical protein